MPAPPSATASPFSLLSTPSLFSLLSLSPLFSFSLSLSLSLSLCRWSLPLTITVTATAAAVYLPYCCCCCRCYRYYARPLTRPHRRPSPFCPRNLPSPPPPAPAAEPRPARFAALLPRPPLPPQPRHLACGHRAYPQRRLAYLLARPSRCRFPGSRSAQRHAVHLLDAYPQTMSQNRPSAFSSLRMGGTCPVPTPPPPLPQSLTSPQKSSAKRFRTA